MKQDKLNKAMSCLREAINLTSDMGSEAVAEAHRHVRAAFQNFQKAASKDQARKTMQVQEQTTHWKQPFANQPTAPVSAEGFMKTLDLLEKMKTEEMKNLEKLEQEIRQKNADQEMLLD
jgi:hypothetical protein